MQLESNVATGNLTSLGSCCIKRGRSAYGRTIVKGSASLGRISGLGILTKRSLIGVSLAVADNASE